MQPAPRPSRRREANPTTLTIKDRLGRVAQVFTEGAPIQQVDLFAGRVPQMQQLLDVVHQPGKHAVVYGERGVGKTSLATVMRMILSSMEMTAVRVPCDGTDTFRSIWVKVLDEVRLVSIRQAIGFGRHEVTDTTAGADLLPANSTPNDVKRLLRTFSQDRPFVVFIDEFDRLEDGSARRLIADTIKALSDEATPSTIVVVGVAATVSELIGEHESIERALDQIPMPRMSGPELADIVDRGLKALQMTTDPRASTIVTKLSQGLPHYTHLLAKHAVRSALLGGRTELSTADVDSAIGESIKRAQRTIIEAYDRAVFSPRDTLYPVVLLACAMAHTDDLGYFTAASVRNPLSEVIGRRVEIPAFARHLNALSEAARGPAFIKQGTARRFRYRFVNPLLQPYVTMRGLADGRIDHNKLTSPSPDLVAARRTRRNGDETEA